MQSDISSDRDDFISVGTLKKMRFYPLILYMCISPLLILFLFFGGLLFTYWIIPFTIIFVAYSWKNKRDTEVEWFGDEEYRSSEQWRTLAAYFSLRAIEPKSGFDPTKKYLFACHPHGAWIPMSFPLYFCSKNNSFSFADKHPDMRVKTISDRKSLKCPFMREILIDFGSMDCDKKYVSAALEKGIGIVTIIGGHKEAIMSKRGEENIFINSRKGFIKMALQYDTYVIPVYTFGESDVWSTVKSLVWIRKFLYNYSLDFPVFYGRSYLPFPFKTNLTMVMGEPIKFGHFANPTNEEIDKAHAIYKEKLIELFEKHKVQAGFGDRKLNIMD